LLIKSLLKKKKKIKPKKPIDNIAKIIPILPNVGFDEKLETI